VNDTGLMLTSNAMPIMEIALMIERRQLMMQFVGKALIDGTDYGVIPGTGKNKTLLKPGAEKLCTYFGLRPTFEAVQFTEDWTGRDHDGEPFFYYWMRCRLIRNGEIMAEGDGACSSRESKYRYRKAERVCPKCGVSAIIKGKAEYGGGWVCFAKKGGCNAKFKDGDLTIEKQETGRVANPDIADQQNTILKMAQKRSMVAATLIGVNASEFFTQDLDDLVEPGVIDGNARIVPEPARPAQPQAPSHPITPYGLHAADIAHALAETKRRKAQQQPAQPAPVVAPVNGNGPPAASAPPVAARSAGMITSEEAEFDASNAEFSALPPSPASAAGQAASAASAPGRKPKILTHAWFELGEDLAKTCTHYATAAGAFNGPHAANALMNINGDGKWDAITDENVIDAIEALRQRAAAMPAA
jgi:hypothetical protein